MWSQSLVLLKEWSQTNKCWYCSWSCQTMVLVLILVLSTMFLVLVLVMLNRYCLGLGPAITMGLVLVSVMSNHGIVLIMVMSNRVLGLGLASRGLGHAKPWSWSLFWPCYPWSCRRLCHIHGTCLLCVVYSFSPVVVVVVVVLVLVHS